MSCGGALDQHTTSQIHLALGHTALFSKRRATHTHCTSGVGHLGPQGKHYKGPMGEEGS